MRRPLAIATATVATATPAVAAKPRQHVPGCASKACDKRIGKRWARTHRKPRALAVASWYGPGLYGHTTACGQVLQPLTAGVAHKSLPCGTRLRLCLDRCVSTAVIDRGPYVGGRTFDLTAPVKNAIGMGGGVTVVRYRVLHG